MLENVFNRSLSSREDRHEGWLMFRKRPDRLSQISALHLYEKEEVGLETMLKCNVNLLDMLPKAGIICVC